MSYFVLEKEIIESDELSIYEKMCCVVLAKWATQDIANFDTNTLAREMSCTVNKAQETLQKLKSKKLIMIDDDTENSENSEEKFSKLKIIRSEDVIGIKPLKLDNEIKNKSRENLIDELNDIIEEKITDSEARIILNFANNNIEKIKRCYKIARKMQVSDNIAALIMQLQKKE